MSRLRYAFLVCLLISLALMTFSIDPGSAQNAPPPAYQSLPWVYTGGPIGGLGYDVRMDANNPDIMYVTDGWAGVFKSTDGGANWVPSNNGITDRLGESGDAIPVYSLTIDPNNSKRIWVGTQYKNGVYRSDDGGATWTKKVKGIIETGLSVRGFTVQVGNSNLVYMAAEVSSSEWNNEVPLPGLGLDMTKGVVYKTVDGGENWTRIWYGDNLARYVWIHPENPNRLFVSTGIFDREAANSDPVGIKPGGVGILRSDDGGQTWTELDEKNGLDADELYIGSLYMHPTNPDILLAAAGNDPYSPFMGKALGGIYRTSDGGDTWTEVLDGHNFSMVEICEQSPNVAYAGTFNDFFRSLDAGLTWEKRNSKGQWGAQDVVAGFPIDAHCDPRDPNRIFINNYGGGNFLSEDGGATWVVSSNGYSGAHMHQIAVVSGDADHIYTSARSGLFTSQDGGESFQGTAYGIGRQLEAQAIAIDPINSQHILATFEDLLPAIMVSHTGGQSWTSITPGLWSGGVMATRIIFAPNAPKRLYASIGAIPCLIDVLPEYCANSIGKGVVISTDGGETWSQSGLSNGTVMDLVVLPGDGLRAYAALYKGALYQTMDGGSSWDIVTQDPTPPGITSTLKTLAVVSGDPDKLYAGFYGSAVGVSEDGGQTWELSAAGLPPESKVIRIEVDPTNQSIIYAGMQDSGVYVSKDAGTTWTILNDGLLNREVRDMKLSSDGSVLYMISKGAGVFRLGAVPASVFKLFLPISAK